MPTPGNTPTQLETTTQRKIERTTGTNLLPFSLPEILFAKFKKNSTTTSAKFCNLLSGIFLKFFVEKNIKANRTKILTQKVNEVL